jgi:hypothetical protein
MRTGEGAQWIFGLCMEVSGFEPLTACLQSRCPANWSYTPVSRSVVVPRLRAKRGRDKTSTPTYHNHGQTENLTSPLDWNRTSVSPPTLSTVYQTEGIRAGIRPRRFELPSPDSQSGTPPSGPRAWAKQKCTNRDSNSDAEAQASRTCGSTNSPIRATEPTGLEPVTSPVTGARYQPAELRLQRTTHPQGLEP